MAKPEPIAPALVSVLMPVRDTPAHALNAAIASVLGQCEERWELCICDDGTSNADTLALLAYYRGRDPRLKIVRSPRHPDLAGATNLAATLATGRYVGFLDHDALLEPAALAAVARTVAADPALDLVYTDEDEIGEDGTLGAPDLKPDWSPEHLASCWYVRHFLVLRKSLFLTLGGLRQAYAGAEPYDLVLRAGAATTRIAHIREILYHGRQGAGAAAAAPEALANAARALEAFAQTRDATARVSPGRLAGTFQLRWGIAGTPRVTLVVLTGYGTRELPQRGKVTLVAHFLESVVARSSYAAYSILVVDDGRREPETTRRLEAMGARVAGYDKVVPFNRAAKLNFAVAQVESEHVIVLDDDLEVIAPDWIEAMLSHSMRAEIGAVGAKLLYPNGRIQHAGIVLGVDGLAAHLFQNQPDARAGYRGFPHLTRNYSAVSGAAMALRRSVFEAVGGFDPTFGFDYGDIDFCLRVRAAGYRIVYTPHAALCHFERSSLPRSPPSQREEERFLARWRPIVDDDPYYHPALPRHRLDCAT